MPTNKSTLFARRHYEFLARVLAECRDNPALLDILDADSQFWRKLNMHFAARLVGTNINFNIDKFVDACDPKGIDKPAPPAPAKPKRHASVALEGWTRAKGTKIVFSRGPYKVQRDALTNKWQVYSRTLSGAAYKQGQFLTAADAMRDVDNLLSSVPS